MLLGNLEEWPGLARDWKEMSGQKRGHDLQRLGASLLALQVCGSVGWDLVFQKLEFTCRELDPWIQGLDKAVIKDLGLGLRQPSVIGTLKDKLGNQLLWILDTQWKWDKCKYKLMTHYLWGPHIPPPSTERKGQCGLMSDLLPLPQCVIREDTQPFSACFSFCKRGIVLPIS